MILIRTLGFSTKFALLTLLCALSAARMLHSTTSHTWSVYDLPFDDDEYPYVATVSITNATHEPLHILTRYRDGSIEKEDIITPFSSKNYEVTIPTPGDITTTWIMFSFNEALLYDFATTTNTARKIKYIHKSNQLPIGIIHLERKRNFPPASSSFTILNMNLTLPDSWN